MDKPCRRDGTCFLHQEGERYMYFHSKKCTQRKEDNKIRLTFSDNYIISGIAYVVGYGYCCGGYL